MFLQYLLIFFLVLVCCFTFFYIFLVQLNGISPKGKLRLCYKSLLFAFLLMNLGFVILGYCYVSFLEPSVLDEKSSALDSASGTKHYPPKT